MKFVNLHVHSHYSLLDGLARINGLVRRAKEFEMPALALTDHGSLYGAIDFYQTCKKESIKPIVGVETYITSRGRTKKNGKEDDERFHLILLAKTTQGYKNLLKLVTCAHLEGFYYKPRIDFELLEELHEGIIATSACISSQLSNAILKNQDPSPILQRYLDIFGDDFYLELQDHPTLPEQTQVNTALLQMGEKYHVPFIATADSHYLHSDDAEAHDVLLCLQTKRVKNETNRMCMLGEDFSLSDGQRQCEAFEHVPGAIENTVKIAEMCDVEILFGKTILPHFELPKEKTPEVALVELCEQGLTERYGELTPEIRDRLAYELTTINNAGYPSYFLIVHDFVSWAKGKNIMVGPGRGSAAGSLVAYLLKITNIDPIRYDLLFERFLNPERMAMPDIDLDFADSRRDEVLQYVSEKYGYDRVTQIITFGTMAARVSIRDVGRVLEMPYAFCDQLAKLIPIHTTLSEASESVPELKQLLKDSEDARKILDIAKRLEGVARHTSTHACGVVITKDPLVNYVPLQYVSPDDKTIVTQYSLHPIEDLGLLKFDFLGLSNLTILENAQKIVEKIHGVRIDFDNIPIDDQQTYTLLQEGKTTGVFQLESAGMKRYLKELKPNRIEDIIAMVALYRPGPMDLIQSFIDRKHGREPITYVHPLMEKILKKTYGIIVYQEQVMDMATELAGMTKGQGYLLIKAVGKKIKSLLDEQKNTFIQACQKNGIPQKIAKETWELIEPFARYGFNKAHSACYAMIAYQTAYMKAHYPAEFMAALLTSDLHNADRVAIEIDECKLMGIEVMPPDINESFEMFSVVPEIAGMTSHRIRFGLGAIKNVGDHIVECIVEERKSNGPFESLESFLQRIKDKDLNKKSLESLVRAGALDSLSERNEMYYNMERILAYHKRVTEESTSRQASLFGAVKTALPGLTLDKADALDGSIRAQWERELLGLYISEHPLKEIQHLMNKYVVPCKSVKTLREGSQARICGVVTQMKKIYTKKNDPMLFVKLEDMSDSLEVIVFPSVLESSGALWRDDAILAVEGKMSFKDKEAKLLCSRVKEINADALAYLRSQYRPEEPQQEVSMEESVAYAASPEEFETISN